MPSREQRRVGTQTYQTAKSSHSSISPGRELPGRAGPQRRIQSGSHELHFTGACGYPSEDPEERRPQRVVAGCQAWGADITREALKTPHASVFGPGRTF